MSHIFDALKKKESAPLTGAPHRDPGIDPAAKASGRTARLSFRTLRELESLRERLELDLPRTGRRVVAIGASVSGEGASTVGLHLGRQMARASQGKVLLIDGDLSRGGRTLSDAVGASDGRPGLVDVLLARSELSKTVLSTDEPNLHFLPSGRDDSKGGGALTSEKMAQFLEDMGKLYAVVLLDCPPILEHPEAPILGTFAEGMVLVVQAGRTRREVVQRAMSILENARCKVLGVVLNRRTYPIPDFLYRRL